MSQIKAGFMIIMLLLAGLFLFGCGSESENKDNPLNPDYDSHPAGWVPSGHAAKAAPNICTECHGEDLQGGVSGISCFNCHTNGSPFVLTGCTSCHGKPPSTGAHGGHFPAQVALSYDCSACHNGAGSGTLKHNNGALEFSLMNVYSAKSGTLVRNVDDTCSKVSCHGGQTTPGWFSGTSIDVNTQCASCHALGTAEYNSYVSGQHQLHVVAEGITCVGCHDTSKLAVSHFNHLNTSVMEGPASATLNSSLHYTSGGSCAPTCHGPDSWQ